MTEPPPVIEAADAFLGKLAALDLRAAQHVNERLLDASEPAEVASLAFAYARVSRSLRQTLACHSKLKIDREKAAREAQQHAASAARPAQVSACDPHAYAKDQRFEDLRGAVDRVISKAADGDEARHTEIAHRFDRELDDWIDRPDFLDLDVEDHIQLACRRLGLPEHLARTWRTLPEPTFFPDPEEDEGDEGEAADVTHATTASVGDDRALGPDAPTSARPHRGSG